MAIVSANDFTVRAPDVAGGRKSNAAERMALAMRVPIIRLIDGFGGSVKTLESIGRTYVPDNPGWEHILANLATVPVVCFVVAADEGWSAQSSDHRDAIAALGIRHGLIVVTKADRAPELVAATIARARSEFAQTGLRDAPAVAVSALEGTGLDKFRQVLDDVLAKGGLQRRRRFKAVERAIERAGNTRHVIRLIRVPGIGALEHQLLLDTLEAAGNQRREG